MAQQPKRLLDLAGVHRPIVQLLWGSGLRLMECTRLRVRDPDLSQCQFLVRDAKGGKDRVTILPNSLAKPLRVRLATANQWHEQDLVDGYGNAPELLRQAKGALSLAGGVMFFPTLLDISHLSPHHAEKPRRGHPR